MATPLPGTFTQILPANQHELSAWKANDPAETTIFGVINDNESITNISFYSATKIQLLSGSGFTYLGTTPHGPGYSAQPIVYNDGTIAILITEHPNPLDPPGSAVLGIIQLPYKLQPSTANNLCDALAQMPMGADVVYGQSVLLGYDCQLHRMPQAVTPQKGQDGVAGTPGVPGPPGPPGTTGPRGFDGLQGSMGPPGPRGLTGAACECCGCPRENQP